MNDIIKENFIPDELNTISLSVYNVGFQKCESLYQWGPGIRDHYLIHHVVNGHGQLRFNNEVININPGDSFIVYPNTEVSYQACEKDPWEYYWVGFSGTDAEMILRSTDFSKSNPVISHADDQIRQLILDIYNSRGNTLKDSVSMTGGLYKLLSYFLSISNSSVIMTDTYEDYLRKATDYISSNYSYPITIDEIAEYVGISRSHLFRIFKQYLNISPKEYLSNLRIRQACSYLKNTNLSVTAIATSTGFENNLYFSRAFHKIKGVSPTQYRDTHKSE